MAARSKARKRALDILYAAELRGKSPLEALQACAVDVPAEEGGRRRFGNLILSRRTARAVTQAAGTSAAATRSS